MDKRISHEVSGDALGSEFAGFVFRITGGNDKEGFPMKQGVMTTQRVRLLLSKDSGCYRPGRKGERKRRSVRGCIVANDLVVVSLVVVKQGAAPIAGLTDSAIPVRRGPKRANNIRKLFNLTKNDDVRKYVIRRQITLKNADKKPYSKAPKIQRLVTPVRLQRKRRELADKKKRAEKARVAASEYSELLTKRQKEQREQKAAIVDKRRTSSVRKSSENKH